MPPKRKFPDLFPYVRLAGPLGASIPLRGALTKVKLAITPAIKSQAHKKSTVELRILVNYDTHHLPQNERNKDFDPGAITVREPNVLARVPNPMWKKIDGYYVNCSPVDITQVVRGRKEATIDVEIIVEHLDDEHACGVAEINISRKTTLATLRRSIVNTEVFPKSSILKFSEDMKDSGVEFQVVSLKCPCLGVRIKVPVRFEDCTHAECFDLDNFLLMEEKRPKGRCPICNKLSELRSLGICEFTQDLLDENKNCDSYRILPTGIEALSSEEKENATLSGKRKRQRNGEFISQLDESLNAYGKKKLSPPKVRQPSENPIVIVLD